MTLKEKANIWLMDRLDKYKVEAPVNQHCKQLKNVLFIYQSNKETKSITDIPMLSGQYYDVSRWANDIMKGDNILSNDLDIVSVGELFDILMIQIRSV